MAIAGALIGGAIGAFGKKPVVPDYPVVDPNAIQSQTVSGNQANFGDIAKLAAGVNTFNQDQLNALIDKTLGPGVRDQIQSNLSSQLKGEIPQDVQNAIFRGVAQRTAANNAFGGGGFTQNVTARDLGLTSLQITNQALSSAESWLQQAKAPMFDATSMFFTPQQRLAQANLTAANQYQNALLKAGVAAAPDPATAALGREVDRFFNTAASYGMAAAGSASAGGGGGGLGGLSGGMGGGGGGLGGSVNNPYSLGGYGFGDNSWLNSDLASGSANGAHL